MHNGLVCLQNWPSKDIVPGRINLQNRCVPNYSELNCWNRHIPVECRTHLLKQTLFCGMQNSPAETDISLWNAELTCWNRHIPVPCMTYLLDWTLRLEQDTSSQQFSKNAAHTPYINCSWIVTRSHQNLWCTVVLCYHFLRHMFWLIWLLYACQTKVTDLQTQQKTWLHVLHNKVK